ncbi:MAG TPA: putative manganese transporter [Vicinamibacterales bacterium]|nr:putative manganese transporter [Vicinamibacterales bacterium]
MIGEVLLESVYDTARMVPILVPVYVLLEYLSHREVLGLVRRFRLAGAAGPLVGTALGIIPQCSMSVLVTSLFASGRVSLGTLLATYLATSDEALPLMIAEGRHAPVIVTFVALKIAVAVSAGYTADLVLGRRYTDVAPTGRPIHSHTEPVSWTTIVKHGIRHATVVTLWVFLATTLLGLMLALGSGRVAWLAGGPGWSVPRVAAVALFGMIPNCAASIAVTEAFLRAGLPFGTTIAGLSAGAGFGPIVLVREAGLRQALTVLAWLLVAAMAAGLAIDVLFPFAIPVR